MIANKIKEIVGNMAADGIIDETIIVCPNMYASSDPNQQPGFDAESVLPYDNFINDLINDLMPHIESEYSVLTGRENSMSFFLQDKHYFTKKIILNAGLRFDSKYRANSVRINALSPRVAIIYTPKNDFSMKLSYSRSFVDAPYFYRRNTDNSYLGAEDLKPEYLNAVQFDVLGEITPIHLTYDVNLFYNKFTDIIYSIPGAGLEDAKYRNSGKLEIFGAEMDVHYNYRRLRADLTASYSYVLSAKDYYYKNNNTIFK